MDQAANLRKLVVEQNPESKTKTIAITSGKGGVGKTNLSVNLAIALAQAGNKVTLLDADLGLANINVVLGIIPKFNLYHVIKGKKELKDIVVPTSEGIQIISGASGFHQLADLGEEQRKKFIESLGEIDAGDYIIIDTGAGVGQNVLSFLSAADEVVVVTTPEPTAITDAYGIIKSIASQGKGFDKNIKLIVNRVSTVAEAKKVTERIVNIAGQFLNIKIESLGFVFEDPFVAKSIRNQKPFYVTFPKSKASVCISILADKIMNKESKTSVKGSGMGNFVKKLFNSSKNDKE